MGVVDTTSRGAAIENSQGNEPLEPRSKHMISISPGGAEVTLVGPDRQSRHRLQQDRTPRRKQSLSTAPFRGLHPWLRARSSRGWTPLVYWLSPLRGYGQCKPMTRQPRIEILFCNQCRWMLRSAWMAQELLTTFPAEIGEVALLPGTGGVFEIRVNDEPDLVTQGEGPVSRHQGAEAARPRPNCPGTGFGA